MHARAAELIDTLELTPHPEGGYYRELFRSGSAVAPLDGRGSRPALTTIYFLLPAGQHSAWHRVQSDEVWHHYEGSPLELLLMPASEPIVERGLLGPCDGAQAPVRWVPAGWWQAARSLGAYTLVGCTVGPGFEYADFELLADNRKLAEELSRASPEIRSFLGRRQG
jgi:predicted cupin superfamily sugar epimerase